MAWGKPKKMKSNLKKIEEEIKRRVVPGHQSQGDQKKGGGVGRSETNKKSLILRGGERKKKRSEKIGGGIKRDKRRKMEQQHWLRSWHVDREFQDEITGTPRGGLKKIRCAVVR